MIQTLGKYRIEERIGHGGLGAVYKAHDPLLNRVVALKVIADNEDLTDDLRARFYREARACAQLSHPNIITIYDLGEDEGRLFIVLEYLEGENLKELLARRTGLHLERKLAIMGQVCDGLGYAHVKGIVHRVLRPASVFILRNEKVKLLDFGVGRAASAYDTFTEAALAMGTAAYMAPEQVGEDADNRSDMFSAGAVFYELLTDRPLRQGGHPGDSQGISSSALSLFRPDPDIPDDLAAVIERALRKAPEERFASMAEMRTALDMVRARLSEDAGALRRRIVGCAKDTRELKTRLIEEVGGELPDETLPVLEERSPVAVLEAISLEYEVKAGQVREQLVLAELLRQRYELGTERLLQRRWAEAVETFEAIVEEMPEHARAQEALGQARDGLRRATEAASKEREAAGGARQAVEELGWTADARPPEVAPSHLSGNGRKQAEAELIEDAGESTVMIAPDALLGDKSDTEHIGPLPPGSTQAGEAGVGSASVADSAGSARPLEPGSAPPGLGALPKTAERNGPARALPVSVAAWRLISGRRLAVATIAAVAILSLVYGFTAYVLKPRRLQADLVQARQQVDAARKKALGTESNLLVGATFEGAAARERDGERLANAGELPLAITALREAVKRYEDAGRTGRALGEARARADEARNRMLADKQRAATGSPQYEDALRREAAGDARYRDRAFPEAAEDFSAASQLFARSVPSPSVPSPSVPSPVAAAASVAEPPEAQADEEIRKVLGLYSRAFEAKDLKLLQQIRPRIRPEELSRHRQVFEQTRSYRLSLKIDAIKVNGDGAEASGRREDIVVTNDGQTVRTPDDFLFRLKRSNNGWTIEAVK